MADDDILELGVNAAGAVRQIADLTKALRSVNNGFKATSNAVVTFNTSFDDAGDAITTFTAKIQGVNAEGNKIKAVARGMDGEIKNLGISVKSSAGSFGDLKVQLEDVFQASSKIAKQNIGASFKIGQSFRQTLLPLPKTADFKPDSPALAKFNDEYSKLLAIQDRVGLGQQDLNAVTEAYFRKSPNTFILGQKEVYKQMLRVRGAVEAVNKELNLPIQNKKLASVFKNIIEPGITGAKGTKIDFGIAEGLPREINQAKKDLQKFRNFLEDNAKIITKSFIKIATESKDPSRLGDAKKQYRELYDAAKTSYEGIGAAARASADKRIAEDARVGKLAVVKDLNKTANAEYDEQVRIARQAASDIIIAHVKTNAELSKAGVGPGLFENHERAVIRLKKTLETLTPTARDVRTIFDAIESNEGPNNLTGANLDLYAALKKVLDIEGQIETRGQVAVAGELKQAAAKKQAADEAIKALAAEEAALKRTAQARTQAKTKLETKKSFTPQALEFQPDLTERLRKQIANLDATLVSTKATTNTVKAAFAALDRTDLHNLPESVRLVREELIATISLQRRLQEATDKSLKAEGQRVAKKLADEKKITDAEAAALKKTDDLRRQSEVKLKVREIARGDLTTQLTFSPKDVDPKAFLQAQKAVSNAVRDVLKTIDGAKVGFFEYHAALEAAGDPAAFLALDPSLQGLALKIEKATQKQAALNLMIDQTIKKTELEAAALDHTNKLRAHISDQFQQKFPVLEFAKEDQPRKVSALRASFLALDKILQQNKVHVSDFDAALAFVTKRKMDLSQLTPDQQKIAPAIQNIATAYGELTKAVDKSIERTKRLNESKTRTAEARTKALAKEREKEASRVLPATAEAIKAQVKGIFQITPIVPRIDLSQIKADDFAAKVEKAIFRVTNQVNGMKIGFEQFDKAYGAALDPSKLEALSGAERRLALDIIAAFRAQDAFNLAAQRATNIKTKQAIEERRLSDARGLLTAAAKDVPTTGVGEKEAVRFRNALEGVYAEFKRSGLGAHELDRLISEVGANPGFITLNDKAAKLVKTIYELHQATKGLGGELRKSAQTELRDMQKAIAKSFIATDKAKPLQLVEIERSVSRKTPLTGFSPELQKIKTEYDALIKKAIEFGDVSKTEEQIIRQTGAAFLKVYRDEVAAIAERDAKEAASIARRLATADTLQAAFEDRRREANRKLTEQQKTLFPTITAAFGKIPKHVTDTTAINAGYNALAAAAAKAGLNTVALHAEIQRVKAILAQPVGEQVFGPLAPQLKRVENAIRQTHRAFAEIESPGVQAAKGILISWQGVVRIFQAQVIHTALSQLITDFRQAIFEVGNFQREVALIQTIAQDQATNFSEWSDSVVKLANELGKTPTEIATAAYDALSNQITKTKEETIDFVKTAGEFARTTGSTTPDAVNLLSSAIISYGGTAASAEALSAKFFATIDLGRVKASDLAHSYGRLTALGTALGVSIDELNAGLVVLTQQGVKAPDAITQLNAVFSKLLKPTEATRAVLQEWNLTSGEALITSEGLGGALAKLAGAADEGKGDFIDYFNELRSARGGLTLAKDGAEQFNKALKDLNESASKFQAAKEFGPAAPGVELQRQVNELKNVITEDFGAKTAAAIVQVTQAIGPLATLFKRAVNDVIFATQTAVLAFGVLNAAKIATFSVTQVTAFAGGVTALTGVFTNLLPQLVGISHTLQLAFALAPLQSFAILGVTAIAAVGAALAGVAIEAARSRDAQIEAFREGAEAARVAAAETTKLISARIERENQAIEKGLKEQLQMFTKHISDIRKYRQELLANFREIASGIKSSLDISFAGILDDFNAGLTSINKQIEKSKKGREDIEAFARAIPGEIARTEFETKLSLAPPSQKENIVLQRIAELKIEGFKLFNEQNIDEALKAFEEANKLQLGNVKIFTDLNKALNAAQRGQQVEAVVRSAKPINLAADDRRYARLVDLQQQLSAIESRSGLNQEETNRIIEKRGDILRKIQQVQTSIGPIKPIDPGITRSSVDAQLRIRDLAIQAQQAGRNSTSVLQQNREAILAELPALAAVAEAQARITAEQQAQQATFQAGKRNIEALMKAMTEVPFAKTTGELLSAEEVEKAFKQVGDLKKRLDQAFEEQIKLQIAIAPDAVSIDALKGKREQFDQQFADLMAARQQVIDEQRRLQGLQPLEAQRKAINDEIYKIMVAQGTALEGQIGKVQQLGKAQANFAGNLREQLKDIFEPSLARGLGVGRGVAPRMVPFADPTGEKQKKLGEELIHLQTRLKAVQEKPVDLKNIKEQEALILKSIATLHALDRAAQDTRASRASVDFVDDKGVRSQRTLIETLEQQRQNIAQLKTEQLELQAISEGRAIAEQLRAGMGSLESIIPEADRFRSTLDGSFIIIEKMNGEFIKIPRALQGANEAIKQLLDQANKGLPEAMQKKFVDILKEPLFEFPGIAVQTESAPGTPPGTDLKALEERPDVKGLPGVIDQTKQLEDATDKAKEAVDKLNKSYIPLEERQHILNEMRKRTTPEPTPGVSVLGPGLRTSIALLMVAATKVKEEVKEIPPVNVINLEDELARLRVIQAQMAAEKENPAHFKPQPTDLTGLIKQRDQLKAIAEEDRQARNIPEIKPGFAKAIQDIQNKIDKLQATPVSFRVTLNTEGFLQQLLQLQASVPPLNLIDTVAFSNTLDNIRTQLSQPMTLQTNVLEVLISLTNQINLLTSAFNNFGTFSTTAMNALATSIRTNLIPALQQAINLLNQTKVGGTAPVPQAQGFARGGMVPVMLTPGERVFSPDITKKYYRELMALNSVKHFRRGGFVPKGTDTIPAYLPSRSFVLNKRASKYFDEKIKKPQYLAIGGFTDDFQFHFPKFSLQGSGPIMMAQQTKRLEDSARKIGLIFESIQEGATEIAGHVTTTGNELMAFARKIQTELPKTQFASQGGMVTTHGLVRGTDRIPTILKSNSFVLNPAASKLGESSVQYLQTGGMTLNRSFTPQLSTNNRITNTAIKTNSSNNSVSMGNVNINLQGSNVSTESQALQLGKALQRQVRIGRLKG